MTGTHRFPVRVYYEDTDFSGNVYHGSYVKFFERGRTEWLRALGLHHSELAEEGLAFAVRHMEIDFLRAAHIDDALTVTTTPVSASGARVVLDQAIFRGEDLLCSGRVTIAVITAAGKATRLPAALRRLLLAAESKN